MPKKRKRILGMPIGRRRSTFPYARAAQIGALGAAVVAAVPAAGRKILPDAAGGSAAAKLAGLIGALDGSGGDDDKPKLAHLIEEHTDISAPRSVVYNQWTQLEMFPEIAKGVAAVEQEGNDQADWTSKIGPVSRHWRAKITEQVPDERIAWRSEGAPGHDAPEHEGVVTFHSLDEGLTRVMVEMYYKPSGPLEVMANALRIQRRRVRRDLRLFKHFLELRGEETGAWRGSIGANARRGSSSRSTGTKAKPKANGKAASKAKTRAAPRKAASSRSGKAR